MCSCKMSGDALAMRTVCPTHRFRNRTCVGSPDEIRGVRALRLRLRRWRTLCLGLLQLVDLLRGHGLKRALAELRALSEGVDRIVGLILHRVDFTEPEVIFGVWLVCSGDRCL